MTSIRLLKVTTVYPAYLQQFLARNPGLERLPAARQEELLLEDGFGWGNFLTRRLSELGHPSSELVWNAAPLQRAYARELGLPSSGRGWPVRVMQARVRALNPDVVFWEDPCAVPPEIRAAVARAAPTVRLQLGWTSAWIARSPQAQRSLRGLDLVLSHLPGLNAELERAGLPTAVLRHCFEPELARRLGKRRSEASRPFVFCGSLGGAVHEERLELLAGLVRATPLEVFAPPVEPGGRVARWAARVPWLGASLTTATSTPPPPELAARLRAPRFGLDMYRLLSEAKLTLNLHMPRYEAGNMRMFESTGMGVALLTDRRPGLEELFEDGKEVVTFSGLEECLERARWLLEHEAARESIARAGQARTQADHTFAHRAAELVALIESRL